MDENHRGKIKKAPAPEVVKYLINPAIKTDLERSYQTILDINKAQDGRKQIQTRLLDS